MLGNIVIQKHFMYYSTNQMAYDIKLTALNNQQNFKHLSGYIWYLYSNMSVALSGMILFMILVRFFCVGG